MEYPLKNNTQLRSRDNRDIRDIRDILKMAISLNITFLNNYKKEGIHENVICHPPPWKKCEKGCAASAGPERREWAGKLTFNAG